MKPGQLQLATPEFQAPSSLTAFVDSGLSPSPSMAGLLLEKVCEGRRGGKTGASWFFNW